MSEQDENSAEKSKSDSILGTAKALVDKGIGKDGLFTQIYRDRFQPTQLVRGQDAAEQLQAQIDARKEAKKEENLREHLVFARERIGEDFEAKSDDAEQLTFDWIEGVQNVNPAQDELKAFWYAAFRAIGDNKTDPRMVLDAVKKLDAYEAAYLCKVSKLHFRPRQVVEQLLTEKLESKGFIRRLTALEGNFLQLVLTASVGLATILLIGGDSVRDILTSSFYSPEIANNIYISLIISAVAAVVGVVISYAIGNRAGRFQLTPLGRLIKDMGEVELRKFHEATQKKQGRASKK